MTARDMIEHFLLCKFCTQQLWLNQKLWLTKEVITFCISKVVFLSVACFLVYLQLESWYAEQGEEEKSCGCSCWNKCHLFWLIFFGEKMKCKKPEQIQSRGNPRRLSTSKWKSNGKTQSKTNPNTFAALNQKNKSISCFGSKLFRPRPEYYSVWLQCKVLVYQTLSISLDARRTMTCYQRFLRD